MKKMIFALVLVLSMVAGNSMAITTGSAQYHYDDTWVNWPGYTSPLVNPDGTPRDENGTPEIDSMDVWIDASGYLDSVQINLKSNSYQAYDSLFISTGGAWNSWDYFVRDGANSHTSNTLGNVASDGLYSVNDYTDYTFVTNANRIGNPNGIDSDSLTLMDSAFGAAYGSSSILYNFIGENIAIDANSFFVAYAPWCDNDIIGGGTAPVPEPATLILLGSGLAGLALYRRKKK